MTQDLFRHLRAHANSGEKDMDMKPLDARQELLVITMEECGELIQACSKALRRGELYLNSDSEMQLKQEIADVYCMIELMQDWDVLSWEEIERGVERKREKLRKWSKLIEPHPPKFEQTEINFPRNSVTWRQALGDDPRPDYTVTSSVDENGYARITYERTEPTQSMKDNNE